MYGVATFLLVKVFLCGLYFHLPYVPFILLLPNSPNLLELMFLMVLSMAILINLSLIIPVPWAFYFLPIISLMPAIIPVSGHILSTTVLHVFSDSANWLLHLGITPVLGFCLTILHVFSDSVNWLLHLVITPVLGFCPNYPTCLLWFCQLAPPPSTPFNSSQLM